MAWQQHPQPPPFRPPPPLPPPPPRRKFPWTTFWTAIGSLGTAAGIIAAVAVNGQIDQPQPSLTPNAGGAITTSGSTTPTTTPSPDLAARIDAAVLHPCTPRSELDGTDGITSAVECVPAATGPSSDPLVLQYADDDALANAVRLETGNAGATNGKSCGKAGASYIGSWRDGGGDIRGDLVCRYDADTAAYRIVWTFTSDHIMFIANGEAASVYRWWEDNADRVLADGGHEFRTDS